MNFSPPAAEIVSLVWGTPANFNGFCVLAALLHGNRAVGVSQSAAWTAWYKEWNFKKNFRRGRQLYSAGGAAITLGIGPHFRLTRFSVVVTELYEVP